jgi:hypothetical protein
MSDPARRVADDADALRSAAQRLHDHMLEPACAGLVPATLAVIEDTLTTLGRAAYAAAGALVPPGHCDDEVARRYGRAAEMWPSPRGGTGPTHEQQARVLSSLHEAGVTIRGAAAHCGRAARIVAATMEPERRSEAA